MRLMPERLKGFTARAAVVAAALAAVGCASIERAPSPEEKMQDAAVANLTSAECSLDGKSNDIIGNTAELGITLTGDKLSAKYAGKISVTATALRTSLENEDSQEALAADPETTKEHLIGGLVSPKLQSSGSAIPENIAVPIIPQDDGLPKSGSYYVWAIIEAKTPNGVIYDAYVPCNEKIHVEGAEMQFVPNDDPGTIYVRVSHAPAGPLVGSNQQYFGLVPSSSGAIG